MIGELEHGQLSQEDKKALLKADSVLARKSCGLQTLRNDVSQMYSRIPPISMTPTLIMRTPLPECWVSIVVQLHGS